MPVGHRRVELARTRRQLLIWFFAILAILFLPLLLALGNAWSSARGLEQALESMSQGDMGEALDQAADSREDARDMARLTRGVPGAIWSLLPGASSDKRDTRALSSALDDLGQVAQITAKAYPGEKDGTFFVDPERRRIDVEAVQAVIEEFDPIAARVSDAASDLERVAGGGLTGPALGRAKSVLAARLEPLDETLVQFRPLAPFIPRLLGAKGEQHILVALLNPAEQRYSGGAALSFLSVTTDDGRIREGRTVIGAGKDAPFERVQWEPVRGNPFHPSGEPLRLSTASLAPSWSVSGEEMLRAWDTREDESMQMLVAADVVALQDLMRFTGPIEVAGYGVLDSNNLAEKLVGSYDELTSQDEFRARRSGSAELLGVFQKRLLSGSGVFGKLSSIGTSARQRRVALYHRDPQIEAALRKMGFAGDLSPTPHDYLGVFNQAITGLKADYWQRRAVTYRVDLDRRGNAHARVTVQIDNDSPQPATNIYPGYENYVRRDNDMLLAAFVARGATNLKTWVDGDPVAARSGTLRGRRFFPVRLTFSPGEVRDIVYTYDVPADAVARPDGLDYRLDVDPHSLVHPQALSVTVRWPQGLHLADVPPGWSCKDRSARYRTDTFSESASWDLRLESGQM